MWEPEPLPMLGQLCGAPEPEAELPELPELPEPVLEPPVPVLEVGAVVEEPEVELAPGLPVVEEVVAALATSAPPARSHPELNAPTASTLRRRNCMGGCPFVSVKHQPVRTGTSHDAPRTWGRAQSDVGASVELPDEPVTIHRNRRNQVVASSR